MILKIYDFAHVGSSTNAGVVGLYINNNQLQYETLDIYNTGMQSVKNVWVKINAKSNRFVLGVIYSHPNYSSSVVKQCGNKFKNIVNMISKQNMKFYLFGDYNIDLLKNKNNYTRK